ncbi:SpnB-like Rossmann fold domain-containing protein, partial [Streptomyces fuscichromogenes]|uniref:SpnB-like Rossmann fold domain-containing protein n=1 Tax=Streptomyces fuscichromogenes TaxID=1324013 RepID=UPI001671477B
PQPPTTLHATLTPTGHTPHHTTPTTYHLTATTPHHPTTPTLTINQLTLHPITTQQLAASASRGASSKPLHLVEWEPLEAVAGGAQPEAGAVGVVGPDPFGLAQALGGVSVYRDFEELRAALDGGAEMPGRVLVACQGGPDSGGGDDAAVELPRAVHRVVRRVAQWAQLWLAEERFAASELVVVTCGAVAARSGPEVRDLPASAVWGLVRSARTENPGRFALLDLGGGGVDGAAAQAVVAALARGVPEAAVRDGAVCVPRLVRAGEARGILSPPPGDVPWRLDVTRRGTLDDLALVAHPEAAGPLRAGEVRVAMRAGGLNFRDVMIGLGMYPGDDARIGGEGAGVVVETGPGVSGLAVGDRVFGMFPGGGLGPVGVTDRRLVARVPQGMSLQQAAVIPVVYLTAYYGLVDLAGLKAGERLLV